ncbi:hypothetical protein [Acidisoma silvae]|uniref:Uncharacterized protein n=1 Tax=Acidisoma silvae TaxID=2802396 RepID=A0A963YV16_9PROT|nr:hypothetical protein [Acidisoma silvae]MCB8877600.1 hypothetical protein [Acidisoma silvae]
MSDFITVLRCAATLRLAKLITQDAIVPYDNTKTYDAWTFPISDIEALRAILARLISAPRCCVVRGELIDGPVVKRIVRRVYPDADTGEVPTLRDVPRRWLALDMEGIDRPDAVVAADIEACARIAISRLPNAFHGAGCVAQATAGHGIKTGIRLRLWFWLSRHTTGMELKQWLKGHPADPAIFGAAQPIFTAAPVFAQGMTDHISERLVMLPGAEIVEVPPPEALAPPPRPAPKPLPETNSLAASKYAMAALRNAASRVINAPVASRHPTCRSQTMSLARLVDAGLLARSDVEAVMISALEQAGKPRREGERLVAWALDHASSTPLPEGVA